MSRSSPSAVAPLHHAHAPLHQLHVRVCECTGLRSREGRSFVEAFTVLQLHRVGAGLVPHLHDLSVAPRLDTPHSITPVASPSTDPVFYHEASFQFHDWKDELSFLLVDHSASSSNRKRIGAFMLPLTELQPANNDPSKQHGGMAFMDRWFELQLPIEPLPSHHISNNPLLALSPETKPQDIILQLTPSAPTASKSSSNSIGKIHVQLFYLPPTSSFGTSPVRSPSTVACFPEVVRPLRVKIVTWNTGNAPLPHELAPMVPMEERDSLDLFVIGLQETNFDVGTTVDFTSTQLSASSNMEQLLTLLCTKLLPPSFRRIHAFSFWEMKMLVFMRKEFIPLIQSISFDAVPTGIGNILANKGLIVCSMTLAHTKLAFISGHLAAHTDKCEQRNKDWSTVIRSVGFPFYAGSASQKHQSTQPSPSSNAVLGYSDALSSFHHIFLFGDLNYRLEYPLGCTDRSPTTQAFTHIVQLIKSENWTRLITLDQLKACQQKGSFAVGFQEGEYNFPPSFKVLRNIALGYTHKRLPSYTDRILFRSVFQFQLAETNKDMVQQVGHTRTTVATNQTTAQKRGDRMTMAELEPSTSAHTTVKRTNSLSSTAKVMSSAVAQASLLSQTPSPPPTSTSGKWSAYLANSSVSPPVAFTSPSPTVNATILAPQQQSLQILTELMTSDHKPVASSFVIPVFHFAGKTDFTRSSAELKLVANEMQLEVKTVDQQPTKKSEDYMVEIVAPFLVEPFRFLWKDRNAPSLALPIPLLYNNSSRIERELALVRLFRGVSSLAPPSVQAVPVAQGNAVFQRVAVQSTGNSQVLEVENFLLQVQLCSKGALFGNLSVRCDIQWQSRSKPQGANNASGKESTVRSTKVFSPSADEDDEEDEDDEMDEHDTTPFVMPYSLLAQKKSSTRSTLVSSAAATATSTSAASLSASRLKKNGLHTAVDVLQQTTNSLTQKLKAEHTFHSGGSSSSSSRLSSSSPLIRNLNLLLVVFARSEEIYTLGLERIMHDYNPALQTIVRGYEKLYQQQLSHHAQEEDNSLSFEALWQKRPSSSFDQLLANIPLLYGIHSVFFHELEAQLRMMQFGSNGTSNNGSGNSPLEALKHIAELLQQFIPLFSLYRWNMYAYELKEQQEIANGFKSSARSTDESTSSPTTSSNPIEFLHQQFQHALANKIEELNTKFATSNLSFDFFALLARPLHRLSSYELLCGEILKVLTRISASNRARVSSLVKLYRSLLDSFHDLREQMKAFQKWYPSLAQERTQQEEDDLYSRLAGEPVSSSHRAEVVTVHNRDEPLRPSTNAVIRTNVDNDDARIYSSHPQYSAAPITGFRPATSYGIGGAVRADSNVATPTTSSRENIPENNHQFSLKIQAQLKSSAPLAGFYPYKTQPFTQEDCTLHFRASLNNQGAIVGNKRIHPLRARSMSLSSLDLFASAHLHDEALILSPMEKRLDARQSPDSSSSSWNINKMCQQFGVGASPASTSSKAAAAVEHWSLTLPPAFRKLQAGRALIQLIDSSSTTSAASPSPIHSSPSPDKMSSQRSPSEIMEQDSYEEDLFESDGDYDSPKLFSDEEESKENVSTLLDDGNEEMSLASEQLQRVMQAAARAKPVVKSTDSTRNAPVKPSPSLSRSSSTNSSASATSSSISSNPIGAASIRSSLVRGAPHMSASISTVAGGGGITSGASRPSSASGNRIGSASSRSSAAAATSTPKAARPLNVDVSTRPPSSSGTHATNITSPRRAMIPKGALGSNVLRVPKVIASNSKIVVEASSSSLTNPFTRPKLPKRDAF